MYNAAETAKLNGGIGGRQIHANTFQDFATDDDVSSTHGEEFASRERLDGSQLLRASLFDVATIRRASNDEKDRAEGHAGLQKRS